MLPYKGLLIAEGARTMYMQFTMIVHLMAFIFRVHRRHRKYKLKIKEKRSARYIQYVYICVSL